MNDNEIKECARCGYISTIKRKVLGMDLCLSPDTFTVMLPPGAFKKCNYHVNQMGFYIKEV